MPGMCMYIYLHMFVVDDRYDTRYPSELLNIISEEQFALDMDKINEAILDFWPCGICFCFGYACAPLTLGATLLCPNMCISKAEENAHRCIDNLNHSRAYYGTNIHWSLHKGCCTSWVEIEYPLPESQQQQSTMQSLI